MDQVTDLLPSTLFRLPLCEKTAIRRTKTDKLDTMLIIKSLMGDSYRVYSKRDADSL